MGIRTETKTQEITLNIYSCDICGIENDRIRQCVMCGRFMCWNHTEYDDRDNSDNPDKYCCECWEIGTKYRADIVLEEQKHDDIIESINEKWQQAALANASKITNPEE